MEDDLMGFFKDFKEDLSEAVNGLSDAELENATDDGDEDLMVNTLDDPELAKMAEDYKKEALGSIDLFGTVEGNVSCRGKLTVNGSITGNSKANEVFANNAQIDGDIEAKGSVKIGQGTVIVGNIVATSAVIAGAVKGDIDVHGPVVVDSSAVIVGDIKSKSVQINNGATIDGRCSQCYAEVNMDNIFNIKTKKNK